MDFLVLTNFLEEQKLLIILIGIFVSIGVLIRSIRSPFSLYEKRKTLLTKTEVCSYNKIKPVVKQKGYELMAQVRISDVISVKGRKNKLWWDAFKMISSKYVDFVVVDPNDSFKIICAIEIDDSSHLKSDRIKRDKYVNKAFKSAGVALLRCRPGLEYQITKEIS